MVLFIPSPSACVCCNGVAGIQSDQKWAGDSGCLSGWKFSRGVRAEDKGVNNTLSYPYSFHVVI